MVWSLKSFFLACCGCGPLHDDDVELRNVRRVSGPISVQHTSSVPAIAIPAPTEEHTNETVAARAAEAPAPAPTSPMRNS